MFARTTIPCVRPTVRAGPVRFRPGMVGRMGMLRNASTAIPPATHPRPRPNRVLMGAFVGGALLGTFAYQYYKSPSHTLPAGLSEAVQQRLHPKPAVSYDELAKHNTRESCWLLINGHVYDATSVLRWHPAGPAMILEAAGGKDATEPYLAVHKMELLTHLPPSAHLGPVDRATLPAELTRDEDEEEIFRTAEA